MTALPAAPLPRLKLALLLGLAAVIATLALLPYVFGVLMPLQRGGAHMSHLTVAGLVLLQYGPPSFIFAWLGLWFGERYGLTAPWLRAWVYRQPPPRSPQRWWWAILLGILSALPTIAITTDWQQLGHPSAAQMLDWAWRGALAMFQGGITEEIMCRLFTMSLLVWLMARLGGGVRPWMFIVAIVVAALLFGALHLPAAVSLGMADSPLAIVRIVLPNLIVGLPCGWLFWKYGLEHAMVAHFAGDFVLHVGSQLVLAALA